jgi:hypothetical protein
MRAYVLILACAWALPAQESIHLGSISGQVTDPAGATVAHAAVAARQVSTNQTVTLLSDAEGRFRFSYLRVGEYEVTVASPGFAKAARRLTLTAGGAVDLPIELTVDAAESAAITVVGESARTQVAGTVAQTEVRDLPLNGRSFLDAALLIPGVSPTNTGSNQLFAETSAVPGQGISIASQRNFSNSFMVDGLSGNDDAAGLSGIFLSLDSIEQIQVVTSGAQAELGRALGGYVNVVTKSGGSDLHGDVYGYFRNQRLNASNPISNAKLPITQSQHGASLGGPVVADRTFYFANFEQRILNQSGLVTIAPANAAILGLPTGIYSNPVKTANFLVKIDQKLAENDLFSARYSLYHVNSTNSRGAGGLNAVSASAGLDSTDHSIAFGNVATFSERTVNETRGQFTSSHLDALPTDPFGPAVTISGVATFGTMSGSPTGRTNRLYEVADNFSRQAGAHALRAGADFLYNDLTVMYPRSARGQYSFSSIANYLAGAYNNAGFTQTFGPSVASLGNPNLGVYVQDEWKANRRLTLNLGARYDFGFAPRAGFAWSPDSKTVVRGSFGLFYDRIPLRARANALLSELGQATVSLSPAQAGAPVFPNILPGATPPAGLLYNLTMMAPDMKNAYSAQGSVEVERQIGQSTSVSVGYQHLRGIHLIASMNQNAPRCVAAGSNNGCRPDPNYANIAQYSPAADSWYDGLHVSFVRRMSRWGSVRVAYTYSQAMDDVGEFFFSSPIDNSNIWRDYGRSDDDQRHRVVVHGTLTPRRGWSVSGVLQYYSALPLNVLAGSNTVQGTAARPVVNGDFLARNAGTGNDLFTVSARVSKSFAWGERVRVEATAEAFNAMNHRNNVALNATFGPGAYPANPLPTFGQATVAGDPRGGQLGLRVSF